MYSRKRKILVDAREFQRGKVTGIGRVLTGLIETLAESQIPDEILMVVYNREWIPEALRNNKKIKTQKSPTAYLRSEKYLSDLSKNSASLFISPYPKLPLFGCFCKSIHIVHDVLYLTHSAYRKNIRVIFDRYRLLKALKMSNITWYDSLWSLNETKKTIGFTGRNPIVRYPGIDERFNPIKKAADQAALRRYELKPDYILSIGNGLPHKNLGVLLQAADNLSMPIVFIGVSDENKSFWLNQHMQKNTVWINHVVDNDLPALVRCAFCLVQSSTAEGYGYPPLEAMACGVPAIISSIPVLIETTGGAAMTANPCDSISWLNAFTALDDREIYQGQVDKGLKHVEQIMGNKAWEKYLNDIIHLFEVN